MGEEREKAAVNDHLQAETGAHATAQVGGARAEEVVPEETGAEMLVVEPSEVDETRDVGEEGREEGNNNAAVRPDFHEAE